MRIGRMLSTSQRQRRCAPDPGDRMAFFEWILETLRDPGELIRWGGYPALGLVIFAETGAMIFFLPGDSLLFVAGLYAARGDLSLLALNALLIPLAILGDATSYYIGSKTGPKIFSKPETRFFKPSHIKAAHAFYEKHGGKAIVLARFMPIVRTFVPVAAGVAGMRYRDFAAYNILGGTLWISSLTVMGYYLGQFEWIGRNIDKAIVVIVFLSILPGIVEYLKARSARARAAASGADPST
jgi:membrane-associated protein